LRPGLHSLRASGAALGEKCRLEVTLREQHLSGFSSRRQATGYDLACLL
jgi:hypothetical protein